MQISTSSFYDSAASWMSNLSSQVSQVSNSISTTHKIQAPSDDPVASARLTSLQRTTSNEAQYSDNLTTASSLLQQTDDAMGSIATDLQQAQELALQAANGTMAASDKASIADQLDAILDSMMTTANAPSSQGQPLFAGADGKTPFSKDASGNVVSNSTGTPPSIPISATNAVAATESGARAFGGIDDGKGGTTDMFAIVKTLADTLRANGTTDQVSTSITALKNASAQVTNARASVDARASAVKLQSTQNDALATDRETERSALQDTDVTQAYVKLQQLSTTLSATQASFTKLAGLSLFNYLS